MSDENDVTAASVELRVVRDTDGVGIDRIDSDWGVIEHPRAYPPDRVGHLILVSKMGFCDLLRHGPNNRDGIDTTSSATLSDSGESLRMFFHLDYLGQRWTWELFDAHWADGFPDNVYIGRWPD